MTDPTTEPPLCLTRDGAYVWAQAAALRAHDAGDTKTRNRAWDVAGRYAAGRTLDELLVLNREARSIVNGATVQPVTEEQARAMKRGAQVLDNQGRTWTKQITLWHRASNRSTGDIGDKWPFSFVASNFGPMWPVGRPE